MKKNKKKKKFEILPIYGNRLPETLAPKVKLTDRDRELQKRYDKLKDKDQDK